MDHLQASQWIIFRLHKGSQWIIYRWMGKEHGRGGRVGGGGKGQGVGTAANRSVLPDIAALTPLSLPWNVPGEGVVWWYGE